MKVSILILPFLFTASLVSEFLTVLSLPLRFILDSALAVVDGFSKKMDVVEYKVSFTGINFHHNSYGKYFDNFLVTQYMVYSICSIRNI